MAGVLRTGGGMMATVCPHQFVYSLGAGKGHCLRCHGTVHSTGVYDLDPRQVDSEGMAQKTYRRYWVTQESDKLLD